MILGKEVPIVSGDASVVIGCDVDIGPRVLLFAGTHDNDMVEA